MRGDFLPGGDAISLRGARCPSELSFDLRGATSGVVSGIAAPSGSFSFDLRGATSESTESGFLATRNYLVNT